MMTASYGSLAVARPRTVSRRDNCELATRHEPAGSAYGKENELIFGANDDERTRWDDL